MNARLKEADREGVATAGMPASYERSLKKPKRLVERVYFKAKKAKSFWVGSYPVDKARLGKRSGKIGTGTQVKVFFPPTSGTPLWRE